MVKSVFNEVSAPISSHSKEKHNKDDLINLNNKSWQIIDGYKARRKNGDIENNSTAHWPQLYAAKYIG